MLSVSQDSHVTEVWKSPDNGDCHEDASSCLTNRKVNRQIYMSLLALTLFAVRANVADCLMPEERNSTHCLCPSKNKVHGHVFDF